MGTFRAPTALALLLCARIAHAQADPVDAAVDQLKNNEDFRVRTQAALALGASKDARALDALCAGLDDSSTTVRAAAGAALGKLSLGGKECLSAHLDGETNVSVKSVIKKALDGLKAAERPAVTADTKYYVAIGPATDRTGREGTAVDDMVYAAMAEAARSMDGAVIAPRDETPADAKKLLSKYKKVKAFFLWPTLPPPDYSGGNLALRVEVAVFSYPGKALRGTIPLKIKMPGVSGPDRSAEDDLIKQAAGAAYQRFAENADRMLQ